MNHKLKIKNLGKYVREVSVVVFGVAITLSVTIWISQKSEKRDVDLYLNTIKMELEENIIAIDKSIEYLRPAAKYEAYLRLHDKKSLNEDTLGYYASFFYEITTFRLKTNAFEMVKGSGIMRLLDDKELLLSTWDVYSDIVSVNEHLKWYSDKKWEYMEKDLLFVERGTLSLSKLPNVAPMYNFYNWGLSSGTLEGCKDLLKKMTETVEKLEKRK
jgi:hypothetical protein